MKIRKRQLFHFSDDKFLDPSALNLLGVLMQVQCTDFNAVLYNKKRIGNLFESSLASMIQSAIVLRTCVEGCPERAGVDFNPAIDDLDDLLDSVRADCSAVDVSSVSDPYSAPPFGGKLAAAFKLIHAGTNILESLKLDQRPWLDGWGDDSPSEMSPVRSHRDPAVFAELSSRSTAITRKFASDYDSLDSE